APEPLELGLQPAEAALRDVALRLQTLVASGALGPPGVSRKRLAHRAARSEPAPSPPGQGPRVKVIVWSIAPAIAKQLGAASLRRAKSTAPLQLSNHPGVLNCVRRNASNPRSGSQRRSPISR